jgi:hypothetical protein
MAEESTTGSALYSVGTGVIGDFSVEARKNAMDRMAAEGVERKRKQQETEKKSEDAFTRLNELKTGGARAYSEYLQLEREGISNWLTDGFNESDGKFFSGPEGRKNRVEFNNKIAEFNNSVAYTTQTQADLEKQQALLAQAPESYTEGSVEANKNYMSLSLKERLKTEVPKLQLKVDPIDWEKNLVGGLKPNMFTEQNPSSSGSNRYILKEEALDAHVDGVITRTFTEGAGNKFTDGFKKVMTALYDNDPLTIASAPSQIEDETGSSPYLEGLKELAKQQLRSRIVETQSSGKISARRAVTKTTKEPEAAPVRGGGGTQTIGGGPLELKEGKYVPTRSNTEVGYAEEAGINFDSGDKAFATIGASVVIDVKSGKVTKPTGNITLPKTGGIVQYGYQVSDLSKDAQRALKDAGYNKPTVDMLRISTSTEKVDDGEGNVSGGEVTTLIPITDNVDKTLIKASEGYKALKKAPAEGSAGILD